MTDTAKLAIALQAIEAIANIQQKCEQYWNAHNIGDAEIHAALEFIHREAAHIYHSLEPKR